MARTVSMQWRLRQVMAERGMFQTSDLMPLLAERDIELTRQYVHRLVTRPPQRINIDLLAALCDILECTAADLLELRVDEVRQHRTGTAEGGPGVGNLRPIRARVRRPGQHE